MRFKLHGTLDNLFVKGVPDVVLDGDDDCFVHLVADNRADACLSEIAFTHLLCPPFRLLRAFQLVGPDLGLDPRDVLFDVA